MRQIQEDEHFALLTATIRRARNDEAQEISKLVKEVVAEKYGHLFEALPLLFGIGVEIVVPSSSSWSVGPGTGKGVQGWNPDGSGRTFWSQAWNRGGAACDIGTANS